MSHTGTGFVENWSSLLNDTIRDSGIHRSANSPHPQNFVSDSNSFTRLSMSPRFTLVVRVKPKPSQQ